LVESFQVTPYNIRVCLAFPPDTDTPGYVEEMKTKVVISFMCWVTNEFDL